MQSVSANKIISLKCLYISIVSVNAIRFFIVNISVFENTWRIKLILNLILIIMLNRKSLWFVRLMCMLICCCQTLIMSIKSKNFFFFLWECKHEELVQKYYEIQHHLSHSDVLVEKAWFRMLLLHPFFGAWWIFFLKLLWSRHHRNEMPILCQGPLCSKWQQTLLQIFALKTMSVEASDWSGTMPIIIKYKCNYFFMKNLTVILLLTERNSTSHFVERVTPDWHVLQTIFKKCIMPKLKRKY